VFDPAQLVGDMRHCIPRMPDQHAWSRVAHDFARLLPLRALVTMDRTAGADRFALAVGALLQTLFRVFDEAQTAQTGPMTLARMMIPAVDFHHAHHGPVFPAQPSL